MWLIESNLVDCIVFLYSQFWAQRGVRIVAWTVNDIREKDYFKLLGVPFMTDTLES